MKGVDHQALPEYSVFLVVFAVEMVLGFSLGVAFSWALTSLFGES
jgi:hypothetical protein